MPLVAQRSHRCDLPEVLASFSLEKEHVPLAQDKLGITRFHSHYNFFIAYVYPK